MDIHLRRIYHGENSEIYLHMELFNFSCDKRKRNLMNSGNACSGTNLVHARVSQENEMVCVKNIFNMLFLQKS